MKIDARSNRKATRKRARLVITACVVGAFFAIGTLFAIIHRSQPSENKNTTQTEEHQPGATEAEKSQPMSPSSAVPAQSTPPETATTQVPTSPSTPTPKQISPPSMSSCFQKQSDIYVNYNNTLAIENARHQAVLAALKADYDDGYYEEPFPYDPEYQSDLQEENRVWNEATTAINAANQAAMAANPC